MSDNIMFDRRRFMAGCGAAGAMLWAGRMLPGAEPSSKRPRVAAVFTEFRLRSHAYNILENFIRPYLFSGKLTDPGVDVVSFYADQFPENDMAREASQRFGIPLFKTIDQSLCLGGRELAVDAVLLIGEHGEYPLNERGQRMYPRKEFFDQIVAVMKRSERFVPIFNDKHLSYRWDWAKEMYDTAAKHGIPLMAGSSVPLAERRPAIEMPAGAEIEEAVSIHGGAMESYDFHGLEVLQSMIEFRKGGETGISRIELLTGDALHRARQQGRWSQQLVDAAMAAEENLGRERQARPRNETLPQTPDDLPDRKTDIVHALLVTYKDGLRATVLKVGSNTNRWNFSCKLRGNEKPLATAFYNGPWGNRCLFKALSHAIQHLFITGKQPYSVERTLLVGGALDAAMRSHELAGKPIDTPHLEFAYQPIEFGAFRETGASWKLITKDTPQPTTFEPGDAALLQGR
jgi:hypothetical protein